MIVRICLAAAVLFGAAPARADEAGFRHVTTPGGIEVGIWYPAIGTPVHQRLGLHAQDIVPGSGLPQGRHPLVVISHGTGGDFAGHVDTAIALARAGFIVAALTHPGDNWRDSSRATQVEARPPALSALIDYMLTTWPGHGAIDGRRIGAFGFSAGGFTVLAAAGGRPDLALTAGHCREHPALFDCKLLASQPRAASGPWQGHADRRIRAIVVVAPALGYAFGKGGLAGVTMPVQLWKADADTILPAPLYADAVRDALPTSPEFHAVPGAGHFDFLAPCVDAAEAPMICTSGAVFDRAAFHDQFNREVVRFLKDRLG